MPMADDEICAEPPMSQALFVAAYLDWDVMPNGNGDLHIFINKHVGYQHVSIKRFTSHIRMHLKKIDSCISYNTSLADMACICAAHARQSM